MRNIITTTGLNDEVCVAIATIFSNEGITGAAELSLFSDKEIESMIKNVEGLNAVGIKKVLKVVREAKAEESQVILPEIPEEFNSSITLTVNGNLNIPMDALLAYVRVVILNKLGIEDIGLAVANLVTSRLDGLDEAASVDQLRIFQLTEKFRRIDDTIFTSILNRVNIKLGLVNQRKGIIELGDAVLLPSLVSYLNDVMDFRHDISGVDSYMLNKMFGRSNIGSDVDYANLVVATQEFIINTNKVLKGLNTLIIKETYRLYVELFDLIQDKALLEFLGAKDTGDLMRALGVSITPRDLKLYEQLPNAIYALLSVAGSDGARFKDPQVVYAYLQKVWGIFQTLNLSGMAEKRGRVSRELLID